MTTVRIFNKLTGETLVNVKCRVGLEKQVFEAWKLKQSYTISMAYLSRYSYEVI